jgi:hypothetical protein
MDIFDLDIERVAKSLMTQVRISEVGYEQAWDQYIGREVKLYYTYEEVMAYIVKNFFSLREGERQNDQG